MLQDYRAEAPRLSDLRARSQVKNITPEAASTVLFDAVNAMGDDAEKDRELIEIVRNLMSKGANPHSYDDKGHTAWTEAVKIEGRIKIQIKTQQRRADQFSPIIEALFEAKDDQVNVDRMCSFIRPKNKKGNRLTWAKEYQKLYRDAFLFTANQGYCHAVDILLQADAAADQEADKLFSTPANGDIYSPINEALWLAAARGDEKMVDVLIRHHADPVALNQNGETALILAAKNGQLEVVKALLQIKCVVIGINAQDGKRHIDTALDCVRDQMQQLDNGGPQREAYKDVARELLKKGANFSESARSVSRAVLRSLGRKPKDPIQEVLSELTPDEKEIRWLNALDLYLNEQNPDGQAPAATVNGEGLFATELKTFLNNDEGTLEDFERTHQIPKEGALNQIWREIRKLTLPEPFSPDSTFFSEPMSPAPTSPVSRVLNPLPPLARRERRQTEPASAPSTRIRAEFDGARRRSSMMSSPSTVTAVDEAEVEEAKGKAAQGKKAKRIDSLVVMARGELIIRINAYLNAYPESDVVWRNQDADSKKIRRRLMIAAKLNEILASASNGFSWDEFVEQINPGQLGSACSDREFFALLQSAARLSSDSKAADKALTPFKPESSFRKAANEALTPFKSRASLLAPFLGRSSVQDAGDGGGDANRGGTEGSRKKGNVALGRELENLARDEESALSASCDPKGKVGATPRFAYQSGHDVEEKNDERQKRRTPARPFVPATYVNGDSDSRSTTPSRFFPTPSKSATPSQTPPPRMLPKTLADKRPWRPLWWPSNNPQQTPGSSPQSTATPPLPPAAVAQPQAANPSPAAAGPQPVARQGRPLSQDIFPVYRYF